MKTDEMPKEARYEGASVSASSTGLGPATRGSTTSSRTRSSSQRALSKGTSVFIKEKRRGAMAAMVPAPMRMRLDFLL
jgi:hypothetical protein